MDSQNLIGIRVIAFFSLACVLRGLLNTSIFVQIDVKSRREAGPTRKNPHL